MGEVCSDGITKNRVLSSGKEKERNRVQKTEKWIKHYSNSHRILLVGEGDFSFSACLARAFGSANNMVATSLDSKDMLVSKHWTSVANVEELKRSCCLVLHGVNVKDMHKNHRILKRSKFDRIVFNFPHAGYFLFLSETQSELIEIHKELLAAFFRSARELISDDGEIHVSHRNDHPYHQWDLEKLAKKAGLVLIEMAEFCKADYPGYHHKRGDGTKSNRSFPLKEPFTFKFSLNSKSRSLLLNSSVIRSCLISVMQSCLEEIQIYPSNLGSSQQANLKTQLPWMEPGSDTTYCAEALKTNITKQTKMEEREEKYNHTESRIQNPETGGESYSNLSVPATTGVSYTCPVENTLQDEECQPQVNGYSDNSFVKVHTIEEGERCLNEFRHHLRGAEHEPRLIGVSSRQTLTTSDVKVEDKNHSPFFNLMMVILLISFVYSYLL